jgi:hypothetical protein
MPFALAVVFYAACLTAVLSRLATRRQPELVVFRLWKLTRKIAGQWQASTPAA